MSNFQYIFLAYLLHRVNSPDRVNTLYPCTWWPAQTARCSGCSKSPWHSRRPTSSRLFTSASAPIRWPSSPKPATTSATSSPSCSPSPPFTSSPVPPPTRRPSAISARRPRRLRQRAHPYRSRRLDRLSAVHRLYAPVVVQPRIMMRRRRRRTDERRHRRPALEVLPATSTSAPSSCTCSATRSPPRRSSPAAGHPLHRRHWIDPALSLVIAGMIVWSSSPNIVRETLNILLEGTPISLSLARGSCRRQLPSPAF